MIDRRGTVFSILLLLSVLTSAEAQQTREQSLQQQREEKARRLEPENRGKIEAALFKIEDDLLIERLFNPPRGIYARVGGIGEGAGFGGGPGYRYSTHDVDFRVSGAASLKRYWLIETQLLFPRLGHDRVFAEIFGRHRDFPQEDFFGLGPDSLEQRRTNYALRDTMASGTVGVRLADWATLGGRVEYLSPDIGRGTDKGFASTETIFTEADTPGLIAQPDFLRLETFLAIDYSEPPLNPRAGGRYRFSFQQYHDRDLDRFSFDRLDVDLQQYLPFWHRSHTLVLRGLLSLSETDEGHDVPFFLQRWLGGAYILRGFRTFRFRDRNRLGLQAEYRWEINAFTTGAFFYDAGKVASRREDLDFKDLERSYGFGIRFGSTAGVSFRTDIAFGSGEGTRYLVRFDNVF